MNNTFLDTYLLYLQKTELSEICIFRSKNPLKRIKNLKIIDKLGLDKSKTLIMGSGVLVLHGIIEKNDDLDLIVTRDIFNQLSKIAKKRFSGVVKDFKYKKVFYRTQNKKMEAAVNFQILGKSTDELLRRAEEEDKLDLDLSKFCTVINNLSLHLSPEESEKHYEEISALIIHYDYINNGSLSVTPLPYGSRAMPGGKGILYSPTNFPPLLQKIIICYIDYYTNC